MKKELECLPGWMKDVVYNAHISTMASHDLQWCMQCLGHMNMKYTVPIPDEEADDLYNELNKRFISWTGKSLASWSRTK